MTLLQLTFNARIFTPVHSCIGFCRNLSHPIFSKWLKSLLLTLELRSGYGRMLFLSQGVLPIVGMGGYSRRCPSLVRVLPITSPATCPLLVRVLPILSTGHFSSIFFVSKVILFVLGPFLMHTRHTGYLVKSSTSVNFSEKTCSRRTISC